ncbi:MAG: cytochrome c-type biogenesis protein [Rhodospirillaceae bacterium]
MTRWLLALALFVAIAAPAGAVDPHEKLADPALEARARDISKGLRCVVCQNQSIDDSDATLARDLRLLVRERLTAGDSDNQVVDYVVSRYGDFVLLKPPFKAATLALWAGPAVIVLFALLGAFFYFRRQRAIASGGGVKELTDDERRRLDAILKDDNS